MNSNDTLKSDVEFFKPTTQKSQTVLKVTSACSIKLGKTRLSTFVSIPDTIIKYKRNQNIQTRAEFLNWYLDVSQM